MDQPGSPSLTQCHITVPFSVFLPTPNPFPVLSVHFKAPQMELKDIIKLDDHLEEVDLAHQTA